MVEIIIGSDHAAFSAKELLKEYLLSKGNIEIIDVGTDSEDRSNYPEFAIALCREVTSRSPDQLGILLCGSGVGMSIVANRFKGVRAALVRTPEEASLAREHNDANVLCLGGRISEISDIFKMVDSWLGATFEGGRHGDRLSIFKGLGSTIKD